MEHKNKWIIQLQRNIFYVYLRTISRLPWSSSRSKDKIAIRIFWFLEMSYYLGASYIFLFSMPVAFFVIF